MSDAQPYLPEEIETADLLDVRRTRATVEALAAAREKLREALAAVADQMDNEEDLRAKLLASEAGAAALREALEANRYCIVGKHRGCSVCDLRSDAALATDAGRELLKRLTDAERRADQNAAVMLSNWDDAKAAFQARTEAAEKALAEAREKIAELRTAPVGYWTRENTSLQARIKNYEDRLHDTEADLKEAQEYVKALEHDLGAAHDYIQNLHEDLGEEP